MALFYIFIGAIFITSIFFLLYRNKTKSKKNIHFPKFSKEEYGRSTWYMLHQTANACQNETGVQYLVDMIYNLANVFPCKSCKIHFLNYLEKYPPDDLSEPTDIQKWLIDFHNDVNLRLGKPLFKPSQPDHGDCETCKN